MSGQQSRRSFLRTTAGITGGIGMSIGIGGSADAAAAGEHDWSVAVVESTMRRVPNAADLGSWEYPQGLYMHGQYLVYRRTGDHRYLRYIQDWVDSIVDASGTIHYELDSLDAFRSGTVLLSLYRETGRDKYRRAADSIRERLDSYPRTSDGGFAHDAQDRSHQLWADGTYMVLPFLIGYGRQFHDEAYADDEATRQLLTYAGHLADSTGLLYHAYDETGLHSWADPVTRHSSQFWCRAIGWYCMACVDVLDILPSDHHDRPKVIEVLRGLVNALARYQDPGSGRWYQVVDRGDLAENWTETSSSAMFAYSIARSVKRGYVHSRYMPVALKGYQGVLRKVATGSDGLTEISDICAGTRVGDLAYYLSRPRWTNDMHGVGAFLIMSEQFASR